MLNCAAAEVRINEVMPNPEDNCTNDCTEWIEIYASSPTNLTNWIINATNQKSNFSFYLEDFLIITKDKTNFLNYWSIDSNKVIEWSVMSLLNSGEDIFLFNDSGVLISSINYPDFQSYANKSYSLLPNSSWAICSSPTPGSANLCASQNSSENQSPQGPTSQPAAVNLSIDYDDEVESEEFNVSIMLYNLKNMKYDIKVYITFEENDTLISQTFDGSWKSSTYYITDAVEGPGSETSEIKMRIKDDYSNFEGDAKINVRIRESETENSVASFEGSITIKKSEVSNRTSSNQGTVSLNLVRDNSSDRGITSNVIKLNSETTNITKDTKSNIYKSKVEYFKQYGIYAFAIVCVAVIFVLLKKKKE
jgi:hypothetical protein